MQTADGRLLRSSRPVGASIQASSSPFGPFRPMWSDGSSDHVDVNSRLVSFATIYNTQPVVATAVNKLSRRIATLPFDGYRRLPDNGRELVRDDSLDGLICKPLPRWSKVHLLHHVAQQCLIHGNAVLAKVRGTDRDAPPIGLWPLDWAHMNAYAPDGGRIEWWSTTQFDGEERYLAVEDTLHFAWQSPAGEVGTSPLEQLGVTIRLEDAAQRHQTSQFKNGARPGGIFTFPPGNAPTQLQMEQTRAALRTLYSGADNTGKTAVLAPGATWSQMSMSPVEVALIEQRKLNREEVGMVYDLAGPLMNDLSHATLTNVVELNKALYRDVVPPWLALFEQTFQSQLLDPEQSWSERFLAFDLSDKIKGEPLELAETLKLQVEAGLITRNEARRILNMPPLDDPAADSATVNANNQAPLAAMNGAEPEPPAEPPVL
ncbi:MAG TPA: phage portal protein [Solirubrobacteraceae bacterium]|nr:phage portal protein [Solirubrobacteraceae bacterium]